ncbi:PucR family transcriptional regulator [Streptomyces coeruleorubidus]|uniref:PucR family transcriptional regulator n=1 Tax=Streptomyces coeruleorubidus TaxID=116188 RepID=UPI0036575181
MVSVVQVSRGEEPPGRTEVALRGAVEGFRQTRSAHGVMAIEQDWAVLLQVRDRPPLDELREQSRPHHRGTRHLPRRVSRSGGRHRRAPDLSRRRVDLVRAGTRGGSCGPSAAPPEGHGRLRDTLRCFLDNAGSIPRTADALRLHRTSLYYRPRQIREITGLDLDNGADRLVLHMGLRVEELLARAGEEAPI